MSGALLARGRIRRMNRAVLSLAAALFLAAPVALAQVPPRGARLSYSRGLAPRGAPRSRASGRSSRASSAGSTRS